MCVCVVAHDEAPGASMQIALKTNICAAKFLQWVKLIKYHNVLYTYIDAHSYIEFQQYVFDRGDFVIYRGDRIDNDEWAINLTIVVDLCEHMFEIIIIIISLYYDLS